MRAARTTAEPRALGNDRRSGSPSQPLAAASERLRNVPGFPRARGRPRKIVESGGDQGAGRPITVSDLAPRLLDVKAAGRYLGVSPWTIRDLEFAGTLARVRVPLPGSRELRKLLFDRADLDRLIQAWK